MEKEKVSSRSHRVDCEGPAVSADLHLAQAAVAQGKEPGAFRNSQSLPGKGPVLQDLLQPIVKLGDLLFLHGLSAAVKAADLGCPSARAPALSFSLVVKGFCQMLLQDSQRSGQQKEQE